MSLITHVEAVTLSAGGALNLDIGHVSGIIKEIIYTKDDFTNGVDFTITGKTTGKTIWTESNVDASKTVRPIAPRHSTAGVASALSEAELPVDEPINITIASGGNATKGTFTFIIEGSYFPA